MPKPPCPAHQTKPGTCGSAPKTGSRSGAKLRSPAHLRSTAAIGQSTTSLLVVTLVGCWGAIGYGFILLYAGMAHIDPELIEAGRLDGAGNFRVLFSIVLPTLRPIIVSLAILNFITALKLFDSPWLITQGGPAHSSVFLGTMIYAETASSDRNLGYASALSILVLVIAIAVSVFMQLRGRERLTRTTPRRKEAADV